MSATPLFQSRVDWSTWAAHAEPRVCEGCSNTFAPNHPRRRFCGVPPCPGRRPAPAGAGRRRRRPSASAETTARINGIQGVLADVVLVVNDRPPTGELREVLHAAKALLDAERRGLPAGRVRQAAVQLAAASTARAVQITPPAPALDDAA